MVLLFCTFLLAFSVSIALTPLVKKIAFKYDVCAQPNHRTVHKGSIPRLGGLSVFIAFGAGILAILLFPDSQYDVLKRETLIFLLGGSLILFLGIYDDVKGANCYQKFGVQLLAATIVTLFGYKITTILNPFGGSVSLGIFNVPFTILWIILITNALNLIDGLDGLAAGISLGAACIIIFVSLWFGNLISAFPAAILAGAIGGFLIYNFNPAKIFLGDSGSLFIGFMLACFSINGTFRNSSGVAIYIPIIVLGIPIIDTLLAIVRRTRKGVHLFKADKEHIHHRLLQLGLSHRGTVLLLHCVSFSWGLVAFAIAITGTQYSLLLLLPVFGTIVIGLRKLGFGKYFLIKSSRR